MIRRFFILAFAGSCVSAPVFADPIVILGGPGGGLFGNGAQAPTSATGINIGAGSTVTGDLAVGLGNGVLSTGAGSVGLGNGAIAAGPASISIGQGATASGGNAIAIGAGSIAGQTASVAIGTGAVTSRINQIVIGTTSNTYTLPGLPSSTSVSVLNGPTNIVISDNHGNLSTTTINTTQINNYDGRIGNLENATAALAKDVVELKKDVRRGYEGTAIALALGGASLPENRRFAVSGNIGTFRGETGFGASAAFRATENVSFNGGIGAGFSHGGVGGRGGVMLAW